MSLCTQNHRPAWIQKLSVLPPGVSVFLPGVNFLYAGSPGPGDTSSQAGASESEKQWNEKRLDSESINTSFSSVTSLVLSA